MITIIITSIIGAFIVINNCYRSNADPNKLFKNTTKDFRNGGIFGAFIGAIIGIFIAAMVPPKTYYKERSFYIESLRDNNNLKGELFLGCGVIEGKMVYTLYVETNGVYKLLQLDSKSASIKYTDTRPRLVILETYLTDDVINYFAIEHDWDDKFIIEIPRGSIKNKYSLDAQ